MAGRARVVPPHIVELHDDRPPLLPPPGHLIDDHLLLRRFQPPPHPSIIALEDRLTSQNREIHVLLVDNQHLAATHVVLKQEVDASRHELLLAAAAAAARARAERDAEVRQVLDLSVRVEAEARAVEGMHSEMAHVRADVQKLGASRNELLDRLQGLQGDLVRSREEVGRASAVRAEIEAMNRELRRGRAAVEYEKKARSENLELCEEIERYMISMAREVEKLRVEFANAEKRARAAAAAAVAVNPGCKMLTALVLIEFLCAIRSRKY